MKSLARRLRGDERGMAALELGLVIPVLLFLTMGAADVSRMAAERIDLQQAAAQTAALAMAQPQPNDTAELATVARQASGLTADQVSVSLSLVCNGIKQASTVSACPAGQEQARYVSVTFADSFVPSWQHFGIAATIPVSVTRQVRVQ